MESYYRLQYEILRLIDDGKISEAQQYLWKKVHQYPADALAIIGFLYFYGVGLKKDEQKGKKILQEAVQKGNVVAADFIKNIEIMIHKGYNYIYTNEYNDKDTDVLSYILFW